MSTLVHFTQDRCPDQEALVSFLYDEFDGSEAVDRRTIAKHIEVCDRCARHLASLGGVRERLRAWQVPDVSPLAFRIASDTPSRHGAGGGTGWTGWVRPAFPMAAAAVLVLGAALGLARLDVQYDKNGFRVHTGWGHQDSGTAALNGGALNGATIATANGPTVPTPVATAGMVTPLSPTDANRQPWHADMQMLAQSLRQEILQASRPVDPSGARLAPTSASEAALLKRVQQLIDQAEVRQQQNLALRITEVSRDFDLQRRSDMAQIEQGFGTLAKQRELESQQNRLLLNAIRTSQQSPAPR
jgi:hypothetical protein